MKVRSLGWILLGCVVTASAFGETDKEYNAKATRSYVLLSAGRSTTPAACDWSGDRDFYGGQWLQNSACGTKGTVYRIGYGYNFNSVLAMEVSYGDFAHVREDGVDPTPPAVIPGGGPIPYYRTWSAIGWEIAAVGTLHLGPYVSLHGKAGWLRANVENEVWYFANNGELWHGTYKEANNSASATGGIQFDFNRDVGIRMQVNRYNKLGGTYKYKATSVLASLVMKF